MVIARFLKVLIFCPIIGLIKYLNSLSLFANVSIVVATCFFNHFLKFKKKEIKDTRNIPHKAGSEWRVFLFPERCVQIIPIPPRRE